MVIRKLGPVVLILIALGGCTGASETPSAERATRVGSQTPTASPAPTETPEPTAPATSTPRPTPTPSLVPASTETPIPSWPNGFQLGAFVEDIDSNIDLLSSSGIAWVARHGWHFGGDDVGIGAFVAEAHANDLRAFVSVAGDWERAYDVDYQAAYVQAVARLAREGADAIEVWDEPNTLASMPVVDAAKYADLLCAAYAGIKDANPDTLVISGAPSPTDSSADCTQDRCGDAQWLEALSGVGAFECADMVGVRYITGATKPTATMGHPSGLDHHSFYYLSIVSRYREAVGADMPLAFSQFGYLSPEGYGEPPPAFWWSAATSVTNQADWTAAAIDMASRGGTVRMLMIWNLDSAEWGGEYESVLGGYAIIRPEGDCPACTALSEAFAQP